MKKTEDIATLEELAKMKRKISPDREILLPVSLANVDSCLDLFFVPEKRSGWINLYKINSSISPGPLTYNTKKEAESATGNRPDYISTIKIEWEE